MEFRSHRLANGLEVVAEVNPEALTTAIGFFVRTGARDETPELAGVSHFLEHMVFKGTPRRSADDVNRQFDEIGAHYNAFTTEESTVYYASVLPEYQQMAVDILADIMRPSLREDDFAMEKNVIVEEIQMYLDQPPYGMDDRVKVLAFAGHPIAHSVIGSEASVTALSAEQMLEYHRARYAADNLVVAAAGKVDFEGLVQQLEACTSDWQSAGSSRTVEPVSLHTRFEHHTNESSTQEYLLYLRDAPAAQSPDRFAAKLLANIVGDDSGSRMYWELVDPGLVESASLGHYDYQGIGMFYTWVSCEPDDAPMIIERMHDLFEKVERQGIEPHELQQAKSKIRARVVLSNERPRSRLFHVGGNWLQTREYRSVADDLASIEGVTRDDLHALVAKYPLTQHALVAVGPRAEFPKSRFLPAEE